MIPAASIAVALGVFILMEGVAWWSHRYVMHGRGWIWHRSHHEPRTGVFEANDLYAVVGSIAGIGLFALGWWTGSWLIYAIATAICGA